MTFTFWKSSQPSLLALLFSMQLLPLVCCVTPSPPFNHYLAYFSPCIHCRLYAVSHRHLHSTIIWHTFLHAFTAACMLYHTFTSIQPLSGILFSMQSLPLVCCVTPSPPFNHYLAYFHCGYLFETGGSFHVK